MYNVYQNNYSMQPQRPQQDVISNVLGNIQNFQQQKQQLEQQLQQSGQMTQEQFMQYSQIANMLYGGLR